MLIAIALVAISGGVSLAKAGEGGNEKTTAQAKSVPVKQVKKQQCPDVGKGIGFYKQSTWKWQTMMGVPKTQASRRQIASHACGYARFVAKVWQERSFKARMKYEEWQKEKVRQWNWQAFPSWIIRLAVCETGGSGGAAPGEPNWYAEGSSSHGTFYSAFNISRSVYDRDAHHMGVRGWNEGPGVPSPYEQAMAVIGHMRLYGDGFTGRCHGIARSSW